MTEVAPSLSFISSLEHDLDIGSVEDDKYVETSLKCCDVWIKFCFDDMLLEHCIVTLFSHLLPLLRAYLVLQKSLKNLGHII